LPRVKRFSDPPPLLAWAGALWAAGALRRFWITPVVTAGVRAIFL